HHIWRVGGRLPELRDMLTAGSPRDQEAFFAMRFLSSASHTSDDVSMRVENVTKSSDESEIGFDITFSGLQVEQGAVLEYELMWGFPDAFGAADPSEHSSDVVNSVGLRSG